jgi:Pyruvate/2-oxoacid:ferredoxin oxidoreductase delta subunit
MCQFCVQHGDGKKWFLEAQNYSFDLSSDLRRRGYMVDFIRDFDSNRATCIAGLGLLQGMPRLVREPVKRKVVRGFRENHYGQPVTLEEASEIFDIATSIVRMPCVCRRYAATKDEAWCMAVTTRPVDDVLAEGFGAVPDGPDVSQFQHLTKDEAVGMLRDAEEAGLMHSVWTFMTPFIAAICNCNLSSGCMAMRVTLGYDTKIMWKGHGVAEVDASRCEGCARCVAHCPFKAMRWVRPERRAEVDGSACWGCGVCRAACGSGAIAMRERSSIPAFAADW